MLNIQSIKPLDGYVLCVPYTSEGSPFKPVKEQDGLDQLSEVIAVSEQVLDQNNVIRKCPVKIGDIIHHAYSNSEFEIDFTKYRYVFYSQIHGVMDAKE